MARGQGEWHAAMGSLAGVACVVGALHQRRGWEQILLREASGPVAKRSRCTQFDPSGNSYMASRAM